jgi:hypothetical protein
MNRRSQFYTLVVILLAIGIGLTLYKYFVLGFTLTPGGTETVWQVQGHIEFDAEGGPAKVSMTMPLQEPSRKRVFWDNLSQDYRYKEVEEDGVRKGIWSRGDARGLQTIYVRGDFYDYEAVAQQAPETDKPAAKMLEGPLKLAAEKILLKARELADNDIELTINVLGIVNEEKSSPHVQALLENLKYRREHMEQVGKVVAIDGIHTKVMRGLRLQGKYTQRSITTFIQVYTDGRWVLIDPEALEEPSGCLRRQELPHRLLRFQHTAECRQAGGTGQSAQWECTGRFLDL